MEATSVIGLAERHGAAAAVVLAVSDLISDVARRRIDREELELAGLSLGRAGYGALAEGSTPAR